MPDVELYELPEEDSPDYFRVLTRNCIETFRAIPNNKLALDYNRVPGKLRAMILDDEEYIRETRSIYARQRLNEIAEIDYLAGLASREQEVEPVEVEQYIDPRDRGKKKPVKKTSSATADRDMLNMRFKAAQMKHELLSDMAADTSDSEKDAVNIMFVPITAEEFKKLTETEVFHGDADEDFEGLTGNKEAVPQGSNGTKRHQRQTKAPAPPVEDGFEIDSETGEVVEKE